MSATQPRSSTTVHVHAAALPAWKAAILLAPASADGANLRAAAVETAAFTAAPLKKRALLLRATRELRAAAGIVRQPLSILSGSFKLPSGRREKRGLRWAIGKATACTRTNSHE